MRDGVGHYCAVALNFKEKRFEFPDSLNKLGSSNAIRIFRRMVKNIKHAWKEGSSSSDGSLNPPTLDGFTLKHVVVPIHPNGYISCSPSPPYSSTVILYLCQTNVFVLFYRHDCGFYMFQFL